MKWKFLIALLFCISAANAFASFSLPAMDSSIALKSASDAALLEFKLLPKKERKERVSKAKSYLKAMRTYDDAESDGNLILLTILAILLPPLAVYLNHGEANGRFFLSILLTLLFWVPGIIFALLDVYDMI